MKIWQHLKVRKYVAYKQITSSNGGFSLFEFDPGELMDCRSPGRSTEDSEVSLKHFSSEKYMKEVVSGVEDTPTLKVFCWSHQNLCVLFSHTY